VIDTSDTMQPVFPSYGIDASRVVAKVLCYGRYRMTLTQLMQHEQSDSSSGIAFCFRQLQKIVVCEFMVSRGFFGM
ncbi:MAG: hypothetical protein SOX41_09120, partial [Psychrobacter sanguinis]